MATTKKRRKKGRRRGHGRGGSTSSGGGMLQRMLRGFRTTVGVEQPRKSSTVGSVIWYAILIGAVGFLIYRFVQ